MGEDGFIYKKEKQISVTEDGEDRTESIVMFAMTTRYLEFRKKDETITIELDSIDKMTYGKKPDPDKLHLILEDRTELDIPRWITDEFEGVHEKISRYAGLTYVKGPEMEKTWLDKLKSFADVSFKIFFFGLIVVAFFGGLLMFLASPCCFGPMVLIGFVGTLWLGLKIFSEPVVEERIWKRKKDFDDDLKED